MEISLLALYTFSRTYYNVSVLFHVERLSMGVGFIYYYFESNLERRNPLMNRIFYKTQLEEYIWRHSYWYAQREHNKDSIICCSPFLLASPSNVK